MSEILRDKILTNPVDEYLKNSCQRQNHEVRRTIWIPTDSSGGGNFYTQNDSCWISCRDKAIYDYCLFSDEFKDDTQNVSIQNKHPSQFTRIKDENRTIEGWSREDLLGPSKVVVDLGSGQSIALLEYSKEFPDTTFIGVDSGYKYSSPINFNHHGVQLIKDDWGKLGPFCDSSVDTFLSVQGGLTWSCEGSKYDRTATADNFISAITKVAKEGCIFLADTVYWADLDPDEIPPKKSTKNGKKIIDKFNQYGWERIVLDRSAFFILTKK